MSIITKMRKQKAVYWPLSSVDDYGRPTYGTAVEIDCRWDDETTEFIDAEGERQLSRATVYVDRDMDLGSVLMLGELTDVVDSADPKSESNPDTWEVMKFDKIPNFKATEFLRIALLSWLR